MSITVQIPTALRRLTAGTPRVVCSVANLNELFSELDRQFPDLKPHLRNEAGETRRFLNIYVNEEDIRFLGGASYAFQDGDEVLWCLRSRAERRNSFCSFEVYGGWRATVFRRSVVFWLLHCFPFPSTSSGS
jgi:molybdopterin converting factor small subunit